MRIIFAGGGTAGHINPALAIAGYVRMRKPDCKILYVGGRGGMEERLVKQAGFDFCGITVQGFKRKITPSAIKTNIKTIKLAISASSESKKIVEDFKPDICIGTGGYVSGPILRTASKMGVPILLHEQNAFPGMTTKMLSKRAARVMLAVEDAKQYLGSECKVVHTGNPVRGEVLTADKSTARKKLGLDERPVILSFGGSLGARVMNESMADIIARSAVDGRYQHIHAYGQYGKWFPDLLAQKGVNLSTASNLDIREYINDMPDCLAAADLVVARAGAITISEIQAKGKPSVLIPSPNVAENHQYHNAMALVKKNAALMIEEKDLTPQKLTQAIDSLALNRKKLEEFSQNAADMAIDDAAKRIYGVIIEVLASVKK